MKNIRYGLSDIVIPKDVSVSKYQNIVDKQGNIVASVECYFIEKTND